MKLKNKTRLLSELAKAADNPKEFIYHVMALQNQTVQDVVQNIDMTTSHFYVAMNQLSNGQSIGVRTCVKISTGLDIDPTILNRLVADYNLNKYLNGTIQNT